MKLCKYGSEMKILTLFVQQHNPCKVLEQMLRPHQVNLRELQQENLEIFYQETVL